MGGSTGRLEHPTVNALGVEIYNVIADSPAIAPLSVTSPKLPCVVMEPPFCVEGLASSSHIILCVGYSARRPTDDICSLESCQSMTMRIALRRSLSTTGSM